MWAEIFKHLSVKAYHEFLMTCKYFKSLLTSFISYEVNRIKEKFKEVRIDLNHENFIKNIAVREFLKEADKFLSLPENRGFFDESIKEDNEVLLYNYIAVGGVIHTL